MGNDFYYAFLTGWTFMLIFWIIILLFIFIRKPPKSRLTLKLALNSFVIFIAGYLLIFYLA